MSKLLATEKSFHPFIPSEFLSSAGPRVISIGGGKGGVGKTLLATNLAISLTQIGFRVALLDLDLGGANAHTCLGLEGESFPSLSDFFEQKMDHLSHILYPSSIPNLFCITGASDRLSIANLPYARKQKLIYRIRSLPMDYIVLDLGAGTSFNTLDFFLSADTGILTVLPEPTSIENTYRFLKSIFHRRIHRLSKKLKIEELIQSFSKEHKKELSPVSLLEVLKEIYPQKEAILRSSINELNIKFVINQVRVQSDEQLGFGIKRICQKYFGIPVDYLGFFEHDNSVWQSIRNRTPLSTAFPQHSITRKIRGLALHIVKEEKNKRKE